MRYAFRRFPGLLLVVTTALVGLTPVHAGAQTPSARTRAAASTPFTVEYYYKVRWGHFDEFLELYKRNHYPLLQREQQMGRIVSMSVAYPVNHAGEANRWDMRFTIVWRDVVTAHDDFDYAALARELYPDQAKFKAEEQRRFALLIEHMDVPLRVENPATWRR